MWRNRICITHWYSIHFSYKTYKTFPKLPPPSSPCFRCWNEGLDHNYCMKLGTFKLERPCFNSFECLLKCFACLVLLSYRSFKAGRRSWLMHCLWLCILLKLILILLLKNKRPLFLQLSNWSNTGLWGSCLRLAASLLPWNFIFRCFMDTFWQFKAWLFEMSFLQVTTELTLRKSGELGCPH